jgi:hypothetical protein
MTNGVFTKSYLIKNSINHVYPKNRRVRMDYDKVCQLSQLFKKPKVPEGGTFG